MKICIIIIYSGASWKGDQQNSGTSMDEFRDETYLSMKNILKKFYSKFKNNDVYYYFTQFREKQTETIELIDNDIYVKGNESAMNILDKTIKSFELMNKLHIDYDFLIRANISTIIDINNLLIFLNSLPKNNIYCGGCKLNLQWLDPNYGIVDDTLFGLNYIQGTSIILSKNIVESICNNKDKLNYKIIDDVSIGLFIKEYHNNIFVDTNNLNKYKSNIVVNVDQSIFIKSYGGGNYLESVENIQNKNIVFYRNRSNSNKVDSARMEMISKCLIEIYNL